MTVKFSTGLTNDMLDATGAQFANCIVDIYSGNQPISADSPVSGTLLARATLGGGAFTEGAAANGLNFGAAAAGVIEKVTSEEWKYTGLADGTARWFRLRGNAVDDGTQSSTQRRIDGSIGTVAGDMRLSSINVTTGAPGTIDVFKIRKRTT